MLLPVTVAALSLLAAVVVPSPSADPIAAPAGGGLGHTDPPTSSADAGPGTDTGTATDTGTGSGDPGPGSSQPGPDDPDAVAEAELRAMFPTLSDDCTRLTENAYGDIHLECTTDDVTTWLIRFDSEEAAAKFFNGAVTDWQATEIPWQDPASGASGFMASATGGTEDAPEQLIFWSYTSPASAVTVVGEAAAQPAFDLPGWWRSVRAPVTTP